MAEEKSPYSPIRPLRYLAVAFGFAAILAYGNGRTYLGGLFLGIAGLLVVIWFIWGMKIRSTDPLAKR